LGSQVTQNSEAIPLSKNVAKRKIVDMVNDIKRQIVEGIEK
jgi:hypothetical protein